jgi:ribosomal protein S18 acetylase RimI-like enzyme
MPIQLSRNLHDVAAADLSGFYVGWPNPPSLGRRLEILRAANEVILAWDGDHLVGFITALTDGVFAAYIPLVEVLPSHQGRGIGSELVNQVLDRLRDHYMIDLVCEADVAGFYERLGGTRLTAVAWRNPMSLTGEVSGKGDFIR